jgi:hypothetical protein
MNTPEQEYTQPMGLDVGTSRIVVARFTEKKYTYESQLNAFLALPYSKLAESLLQREKVFHEVRGSDLVVMGNDAQKFAEVFHVDIRRPMKNGTLNPQEPHSLSVVRSIIARLTGKAATENQKILFSVPAPLPDGDVGIPYHEASIQEALRELGYEAKAISEGLAVIFGELGDSNFTGIGISCGSGLCNVCLSVLSVPVISFSVPKAGDFVDAQAALVTGDLATRMRIYKEQSFRLNGFTADRVQNALTVYYHEMIGNLVRSLREQISATQRMPKLEHPIPLVLSGGTSMPRGFVDYFTKTLRDNELPVRLSEIRMSADPLHATARGALMAALC